MLRFLDPFRFVLISGADWMTTYMRQATGWL
jgi:hypothetical protein